jgi:hypothetical protein
MPVKNQIATEEFLRSVSLPEQTKSYTVISHAEIIDRVKKSLNDRGFYIEQATYSYSFGGDVVLAKYKLHHRRDPHIGMTFNWSNSYNKKLRFGCYIGGFIFENEASFIGTNGVNWLRKHTGTANEEMHEVVEQVIDYAHDFFTNLILMKELMMQTPIDDEKYAFILGEMYFVDQLITSSQSSAIIKNRNEFEADRNNLWGLYKDVMHGLEGTDITKWQQQQQKLHHLLEGHIIETPEYISIDIKEPKTMPLEFEQNVPTTTVEPAEIIEQTTESISVPINHSGEPIKEDVDGIEGIDYPNTVQKETTTKELISTNLDRAVDFDDLLDLL